MFFCAWNRGPQRFREPDSSGSRWGNSACLSQVSLRLVVGLWRIPIHYLLSYLANSLRCQSASHLRVKWLRSSAGASARHSANLCCLPAGCFCGYSSRNLFSRDPCLVSSFLFELLHRSIVSFWLRYWLSHVRPGQPYRLDLDQCTLASRPLGYHTMRCHISFLLLSQPRYLCPRGRLCLCDTWALKLLHFHSRPSGFC